MKKSILTAVALTALTPAIAHAGASYSYSSDTGSGVFQSFDYDGGDRGTLEGVMNYAAQWQGSFLGMQTRRNQVNLFVVDFSTDTSGRYTDAGLTLFAMWGNSKDANGLFSGNVDLSPIADEANDDGSYSGTNIYGLGSGVDIDDDGVLSVDIDVQEVNTPVGFAVTNINGLSGFGQTGLVNMQLTLADAIRKVRLIGAGNEIWQGIDDDGNGTIFTDGLTLSVVPAPSAAIFGLAGLGALGCSRRRKA